MVRLARKVLSFLLLFLFAAGLWLAWYALDLKTRFPDLDLSRSQIGIASWYSRADEHINDRTANGEVFDDRSMTCATWDYPFGEKLLVINALNGRWVVCRVNDRGPAKRLGREIDLTKSAFKKISDLKRGLIYVMIAPVAKAAK